MQHASAWPLNNLYVLTYTHCSRFHQWSENEAEKRIRKQLYMSCRGFSSAHKRAWTSSWMKFTWRLCTKARPSANHDRIIEKLNKKLKRKEEVIGKMHFTWFIMWEWNKSKLYLQFLCPQPESPASAASKEYQGHHPSRSKWPQTHPPHGTSHDHSLSN